MKPGPKPAPRTRANENWKDRAARKRGEIADPPVIVDLSVERPDPPDWMCAEGRERWPTMLDHVNVLRVYAPSDYEALAQTVHALGMSIRLGIELEQEGLVLTDGRGKDYKNPKHVIQRDFFKAWQDGCSRFGLSPADRRGVAVVKPSLHGNAGKKSKKEMFGG